MPDKVLSRHFNSSVGKAGVTNNNIYFIICTSASPAGSKCLN